MKSIQMLTLGWILVSGLFFISCSNNEKTTSSGKNTGKKIGVLLVNHGSRSATWRNALLDLEKKSEGLDFGRWSCQRSKDCFHGI